MFFYIVVVVIKEEDVFVIKVLMFVKDFVLFCFMFVLGMVRKRVGGGDGDGWIWGNVLLRRDFW